LQEGQQHWREEVNEGKPVRFGGWRWGIHAGRGGETMYVEGEL